MSSDHDSRGPTPRHDPGRTMQFDATDDGAVAVVTAVADAEGVDPISLDPLQWTIDAELVDHVAAADGAAPDVELSFEYGGYAVTLRGTGDGLVTPVDADRRRL